MVSPKVHEKISNWLKNEKGKLLNVGCNGGESSSWIPKGFKVYNCDIEDTGRTNFKQADLNEPWPYPDRFFDVIVACEIVEHLENTFHFMRECFRVLKVEGFLLVSTPNIMCQKDRERFYQDGDFTWFGPKCITKGGHINLVPKWELEFAAKEAGLTIGRIAYNATDEEILIEQMYKHKLNSKEVEVYAKKP